MYQSIFKLGFGKLFGLLH